METVFLFRIIYRKHHAKYFMTFRSKDGRVSHFCSRCSRVIREILILAGFTDVYAKIEGPPNTLKTVKAVFNILANQKTHQEVADEKKLHVVLFRDDFPHYPILLG